MQSFIKREYLNFSFFMAYENMSREQLITEIKHLREVIKKNLVIDNEKTIEIYHHRGNARLLRRKLKAAHNIIGESLGILPEVGF